jgi:hypothetical protein
MYINEKCWKTSDIPQIKACTKVLCITDIFGPADTLVERTASDGASVWAEGDIVQLTAAAYDNIAATLANDTGVCGGWTVISIW